MRWSKGPRPIVLLNNLSNNDHDLNWELPTPKSAIYRSLSRALIIRLLIRKRTYQFSENGLVFQSFLKPVKVQFWSWIMVMKFRLKKPSNEVAYYGNKTLVPVDKNAEFEVKVPKADSVIESVIRVGISRPGNSGYQFKFH